jgi:hypothetical protein
MIEGKLKSCTCLNSHLKDPPVAKARANSKTLLKQAERRSQSTLVEFRC